MKKEIKPPIGDEAIPGFSISIHCSIMKIFQWNDYNWIDKNCNSDQSTAGFCTTKNQFLKLKTFIFFKFFEGNIGDPPEFFLPLLPLEVGSLPFPGKGRGERSLPLPFYKPGSYFLDFRIFYFLIAYFKLL